MHLDCVNLTTDQSSGSCKLTRERSDARAVQDLGTKTDFVRMVSSKESSSSKSEYVLCNLVLPFGFAWPFALENGPSRVTRPRSTP